jgi:flagellar biosynthesis anti-sigma factor FlgM
LSDRAREIHTAKKILADIPDVREDKVAAIKSQVAGNTYRCDAQKIAWGMVGESVLNAILQREHIR